MKKYTVDIISRTSKGAELLEHWEMSRERITRQDFRNIIDSLFCYGSESYRHYDLTARVRCEDQEVFTVRCFTKTSQCEIWSDISVGRPEDKEFSHVRRMQVAA